MNKTMCNKSCNGQKNGFCHIWSYEGMEISYLDFSTPNRDNVYADRFGTDLITLIFYLTGKVNLIITESIQSNEYQILPDTYGVHYNRHGQYRLQYPYNERIHALQILFPYQVFLDFLEKDEIAMEPERLLKDRNLLNRIRPITPMMHLVINQILDPSVTKPARNLFFAARVFDLMSCIINAQDKEVTAFVTPLDQEHAGKAQAILKSNLETPPSLGELAALVGVSKAKLKEIFPKVCGMPPYGYLRKLRMEKALSLLKEGEMNVTDTAYEVGYNSISHFSKVFAGHFGMKPSELRNLSQPPGSSNR